MNTNILGIDIAKNVFQLHGADKEGNMTIKKRINRAQLLPYIANITPCIIAMEACSGVGQHIWR